MKELNGAIEPLELVDLSTKIHKAMLNLLAIVVSFVAINFVSRSVGNSAAKFAIQFDFCHTFSRMYIYCHILLWEKEVTICHSRAYMVLLQPKYTNHLYPSEVNKKAKTFPFIASIHHVTNVKLKVQGLEYGDWCILKGSYQLKPKENLKESLATSILVVVQAYRPFSGGCGNHFTCDA